jgi:hypothetical protein
MFLPPLKRTFDVFNIQLIPLENEELPLDKFFLWFTCDCSLFKYIQITILIKKYHGQQKSSLTSPKDANAHDI